LFRNTNKEVKSFSPFKEGLLSERDNLLLKRYLDATRSEMFFASAIIYVEGVGEQFIIPSIAKEVFGINLTEHNISVIPIHCRYFDPYLKIVQNSNLEIPVSAIIDGDSDELDEGEENTTSVANAKALEVADRVLVSSGTKTLEVDLFPTAIINNAYLKNCFVNLGHEKSYNNLINATKNNPELWETELIKRIDQTVKKGRFAQELSLLIDKDFVVPVYINSAISHIAKCKNITM
jgi:putative ATP-dependent endonuclease of OLD family